MTNKEMAERICGYFHRREIRAHVSYFLHDDSYWAVVFPREPGAGDLGHALGALGSLDAGNGSTLAREMESHANACRLILQAWGDGVARIDVQDENDDIILVCFVPSEDFERVFGE
jgi:hypothetical protein